MGKRTKFGKCHLCSADGPLSFEHVPPKAAFNDRPVVRSAMEDFLAAGDSPEALDEITGGVKEQRGLGAYTLCRKCNNDTGAWYGNAYVQWAYQGLRIANYAQTAPSLVHTFNIFPLRIIKMIICMFFSANHDEWSNAWPELVKFVLNKDQKHINPKIRVYAYFTLSPRSRQSALVGSFSTGAGGAFSFFSEISFPPWGYVLTVDSAPPDKRLVDISEFARYSYNDWKPINLRFSLLPIYSRFPGDFRTRDEVHEQIRRNQEKYPAGKR